MIQNRLSRPREYFYITKICIMRSRFDYGYANIQWCYFLSQGIT